MVIGRALFEVLWRRRRRRRGAEEKESARGDGRSSWLQGRPGTGGEQRGRFCFEDGRREDEGHGRSEGGRSRVRMEKTADGEQGLYGAGQEEEEQEQAVEFL